MNCQERLEIILTGGAVVNTLQSLCRLHFHHRSIKGQSAERNILKILTDSNIFFNGIQSQESKSEVPYNSKGIFWKCFVSQLMWGGTNLSLQKRQLFCFVISETTSVPLKARPGKGGRERWRLSVPGKERRGETCYQRENRDRGRICPQTWSRSSSYFLSSCSNPEWKPLVRFLFQARNKKGPLNSLRQKYELLRDFWHQESFQKMLKKGPPLTLWAQVKTFS